MNLLAVMAYLRHLRETQGMTQADVGRAANVDSKQVHRWERGESEPMGGALLAYLSHVNADPADVHRLSAAPDATAADGVLAAERRLAYLQMSPEDFEARTEDELRRDLLNIQSAVADLLRRLQRRHPGGATE